MKLELKNIQHNAALSEETNAYSARLYKDGKHVADVANRGHGGCDEQHWRDAKARAEIEAHFAAMPTMPPDNRFDGGSFQLQPDLELWCGEQVERFVVLKVIKAACRKRVIGLIEGREVSFKFDPAKLDMVYADGQTARQLFIKRNPGLIILNGLSDAELIALYKQNEPPA